MRLLIFTGAGMSYWAKDFVEELVVHQQIDKVCVFVPETAKRRHVEKQGWADTIVNITELLVPYEGDDWRSILETWQNRLGGDVLSKVLAADRLISSHFIKDVYWPETRIDRGATKEHKLRILVNLLLKFEMLFSQFRPTHYLSFTTASGPSLLLYYLCKFNNIHFRNLFSARFTNRYMLQDNPFDRMKELQALYRSEWQPDPSQREQASDLLQAIVSVSPQNPFSTFSQAQFPKRTQMPWAKVIGRVLSRSFTITRDHFTSRQKEITAHPAKAIPAFYHNIVAPKLWKGWGLFQPAPAPGTQYIYFPLQVTPEATTSILAPNYTNQIELIDRIVKAMPVHWTLAVKEHLPMIGRRKKSFYKALSKYPQVTLLDPSLSAKELIREAQVVITPSGTAAFEAVVMSVPCITFNEPNYAFLGLSVHQPHPDNLAEVIPSAIQTAKRNDKGSREETLIRYLCCVLESSFLFDRNALWNFRPGEEATYRPEVIRFAQSYNRVLAPSASGPVAE